MGVFDKLPFGKKKEESFEQFKDPFQGQYAQPQDPLAMQQAPQNFGSPPSYPVQPYPQNPMYPQQQPYEPQSFGQATSGRDTELLRAKMDAIQATLDSLNQRFAAIEKFINDTGRRRW